MAGAFVSLRNLGKNFGVWRRKDFPYFTDEKVQNLRERAEPRQLLSQSRRTR
jgi:hypothetical protein